MGKTTLTLRIFLIVFIYNIHGIFAIEQPNENIIISIIDQTGFICDDGMGSITVTATEGTAPYLYNIDNGNTQSSGEFIDITPGMHTITVQDADACTVTLEIFIENACVSLIKTGVFNDENEDGIAQQGETIIYTFMVINTGNVALSGLDVEDPLFVVVGDPIDLDPGEADTTTFTTSYVITEEDIEACLVINQAIVIAMSPQGQEISDLSDDTSFNEDEPTIVLLPKTLSALSSVLEDLITIYPNPAVHTVTLSNPTSILLETITIYDIQGKMIKNITTSLERIDVRSLQSGIYFMQIESKQGAITKQLIVTK